MNTRQLQYAVLLSQIRNFSLVAEKLNITQPALSKQILSLETELGVKLFNRTSNPLTLTAAGEHFIREAKELIYKEEQLLRSMERYESGKAGQLVIGITPLRSSYLISDTVKAVRDAFPEITVKLREAASGILRKEIAEGKYDFAIVSLPVDDSVLNVLPLEQDRLVLAVPEDLVHLLPDADTLEEIEFSDCKNLPFVVAGQGQEMRVLFDKLCASASFTPSIAVEVVELATAWTIASAGVAAAVLPKQFVEKGHHSDSVKIISIKNAPYTRQLAIVTKRGQYISHAAELAIDLLSKNK